MTRSPSSPSSPSAPTPSLAPTSLVKRSDALMSASFGEAQSGTVILNKETNAYFGMDGVAAFIWEQLAEPRPLADIVARVRSEYEVEEDRANSDAEAFIMRLVEKGLVEVVEP